MNNYEYVPKPSVQVLSKIPVVKIHYQLLKLMTFTVKYGTKVNFTTTKF